MDRSGADWHAWGSRSTAALAEAAIVLGRPDFTVAARREADALWSRFLLAGQVASTIPSRSTSSTSARAPGAAAITTQWFPQIAYGIGPIVEGYVALADATGERKYAVFAGLIASWFLGANPAGVSMYDEKTGRTFDGIDGPAPIKVNRNAGAESTIEALLALQRVTSNPEAAHYITYRAVGAPAVSLASIPDSREFAGPGGGGGGGGGTTQGTVAFDVSALPPGCAVATIWNCPHTALRYCPTCRPPLVAMGVIVPPVALQVTATSAVSLAGLKATAVKLTD